ncbi:MAG: YIP1 family protein [Deltaproteobacteria bacterium]|nr:YIP1 family protein [Deltaproteobacteria bacterium]
MTPAPWGLLVRPSATFAGLARSEHARWGLQAALITGASWAVFLLALHLGGHQPSGPLLLPIPRASYYAWEAAFAVPIYAGMFYVKSGVLHGLARRLGGSAAWRQTQQVAGGSILVSSVVGWLIPDVVVFVVAGFSALATAMPFYVPVSVLWGITLATLGARAVHGLSRGRALFAGTIAWMAHVMVGAPFLR